jgi:hypothetical protein
VGSGAGGVAGVGLQDARVNVKIENKTVEIIRIFVPFYLAEFFP